MDCIALHHTHTTSLRCHPHVPTFEPCPKSGPFPPRALLRFPGTMNRPTPHTARPVPHGRPVEFLPTAWGLPCCVRSPTISARSTSMSLLSSPATTTPLAITMSSAPLHPFDLTGNGSA